MLTLTWIALPAPATSLLGPYTAPYTTPYAGPSAYPFFPVFAGLPFTMFGPRPGITPAQYQQIGMGMSRPYDLRGVDYGGDGWGRTHDVVLLRSFGPGIGAANSAGGSLAPPPEGPPTLTDEPTAALASTIPTTTPEPSTWLMVAVGASLLLWGRRTAGMVS